MGATGTGGGCGAGAEGNGAPLRLNDPATPPNPQISQLLTLYSELFALSLDATPALDWIYSTAAERVAAVIALLMTAKNEMAQARSDEL